MPLSDYSLQVLSFHQVVEVCAYSLSIAVQELLSCHHSDSLENFYPQSASRNSADHVDGVFLASDVVSPCVENISSFIDIHVVLASAN